MTVITAHLTGWNIEYGIMFYSICMLAIYIKVFFYRYV